jgi:hypothetical protein
MLFRETRLVTRSLKPAPWVPRILKWFEEYFQDEDAQSEEIVERLQEMREVYEFAKGAVGNTCKVGLLPLSVVFCRDSLVVHYP